MSQYKLKLVLTVTGAISALILASSVFIYAQTCNVIERSIGSKAASLAHSVAALIETDIDGYRRIIDTLDMNDAYYVKMNETLSNIKREADAKDIYTEKQKDAEQFFYVLDGQRPYEEGFPAPGEVELMDDHSKTAHSLKSVYMTPLEKSDIWGDVIRGYAPVVDPVTGEYLGLVGVNYSADYYHESTESILRVMLIGNISVIIIAIFALLIWSSLITSPLFTDHVTKLYTKSYFEREVLKFVKAANRRKKKISILVIDMDNFKLVNDRYGHLFGDTVLYETAQTIRNAVRDTDCVARFGGDEFIAALYDTDMAMAECVARRICTTVNEIQRMHKHMDASLPISVSIGISEYCSDSGVTILKTMKQADSALYQAKALKNKVMVYTPATKTFSAE